jgi:hypothetical protein
MRARRRTQKRGRVKKHTILDGQGLEGALERKWGLEGALKKKMRGRRRTPKKWGLEGTLKRDLGLGNALPWMVKCLKAHSKGDEGSKTHLKGDKGLKALSKREVGLGNALPWMVEGSKAHLKGNEARRRTWKEMRLEGAFEGGGETQRFFRWPSGLSRLKNSQK